MGESPPPGGRVARLEVFRPQRFDTLAHEAGHMLGLDDEATDDYHGVGSSLRSPHCAALVQWYLEESVTRGDTDSVMSRGDVVHRRHYVTFLEALETMIGGEWTIVPPP